MARIKSYTEPSTAGRISRTINQSTNSASIIRPFQPLRRFRAPLIISFTEEGIILSLFIAARTSVITYIPLPIAKMTTQAPPPSADPASQKIFTIGTRKSKLALLQTDLVLAALKEQYPDYTFQIHSRETAGDQNTTIALRDFNTKNLWTQELEDLLEAGHVDLIVHSLKGIFPSFSIFVYSGLTDRNVSQMFPRFYHLPASLAP